MNERTIACAAGLLLLAAACGGRETPVSTSSAPPVPPVPPPVSATTTPPPTAPPQVAEDATPRPAARLAALSAADEAPPRTSRPSRFANVPLVNAEGMRRLGWEAAQPATNAVTGCVKIVTLRAPAGTTGVDVTSDGIERQQANFIPLGEDWIGIAVPTDCERQTRAFSVRFKPSGQTYSEATRKVVITEPTGPRRAVTPP